MGRAFQRRTSKRSLLRVLRFSVRSGGRHSTNTQHGPLKLVCSVGATLRLIQRNRNHGRSSMELIACRECGYQVVAATCPYCGTLRPNSLRARHHRTSRKLAIKALAVALILVALITAVAIL